VSDDSPTQTTRPPVDRAGIALAFVLVVLFSYSEDLVAAGAELAVGGEPQGWRWFVLPFDVVILAATGLLKRRIAEGDGDGARLWKWWWFGVALALAVDVMLLLTEEYLRLAGDLVASTLFSVALAIVLISSLNGDPMTIFSAARRKTQPRDWLRTRSVVPLIIGTYASYLAATLWSDELDDDVVRALEPERAHEIFSLPWVQQLPILEQSCSGAINQEFFAQMCGVIPLLLVTLGIEFGYFRHAIREPAQRAATIMTVSLLSIGLAFALSALLKGGHGCGDVLSPWHEYLAFAFTVQACAVGLATLVWLLVVSSPSEGEQAPTV
jgi:hypothetical protein